DRLAGLDLVVGLERDLAGRELVVDARAVLGTQIFQDERPVVFRDDEVLAREPLVVHARVDLRAAADGRGAVVEIPELIGRTIGILMNQVGHRFSFLWFGCPTRCDPRLGSAMVELSRSGARENKTG